MRGGRLSARECAVAALALVAILCWIFGGVYVNPTTVALAVVSVMLFAGVVTWDDLVANHEAWKALTLLATLVTLSDSLIRTGLVEWFATSAAGAMTGLSPNLTIAGLVCTYFLSHYLFASLTAHAAALLPILLSLGLNMSGVPFDKLGLLLGLTQGLMGVLTPYATGPARSTPIAATSPQPNIGAWVRASVSSSWRPCFCSPRL